MGREETSGQFAVRSMVDYTFAALPSSIAGVGACAAFQVNINVWAFLSHHSQSPFNLNSLSQDKNFPICAHSQVYLESLSSSISTPMPGLSRILMNPSFATSMGSLKIGCWVSTVKIGGSKGYSTMGQLSIVATA